MTKEFSQSSTFRCPVPGNSVAQAYETTKMAYADLWKQTCWYLDGSLTHCDGATYASGITAPSDPGDFSDPQNPPYDVGCSVGLGNVHCGGGNGGCP